MGLILLASLVIWASTFGRGHVVNGYQWTADTVSAWIDSEPSAQSACADAFDEALAAGTETAMIATLSACNEAEWLEMQIDRPLPTVSLSDLCAARFGLATEACATADAERVAREAEAAATIAPPASTPRTRPPVATVPRRRTPIPAPAPAPTAPLTTPAPTTPRVRPPGPSFGGPPPTRPPGPSFG